MFGIFLEDPKGAPPGSWRVKHVKLKPNHPEKSSKNLLPQKPNPPNKTYSIGSPKMVFGRLPSWFGAPFAVWRVMFFCWWNVTHSKGLSNDSWRCIRTPSKNEDVFFLDWHCGWEVPQNEYIVHCHLSSSSSSSSANPYLLHWSTTPPKGTYLHPPPPPSANCSPAPGRHLAAHRCDLAQRLLRAHPAGQRCGDFLKCWVSPTNPWVFLLKNWSFWGVWIWRYHHLRKHPMYLLWKKMVTFSIVILVFGVGRSWWLTSESCFSPESLRCFPFTPMFLVIMSSKHL